MRIVALAVLFALLFAARPARAHPLSDATLTLTVSGAAIEGRLDLALRDLDRVAARDDAAAYAMSHLSIRDEAKAPCPARVTEVRTVDHEGGAYAALSFVARCAAEPRAIAVDYELFFDVEPLHRGLARVDDGGETRTAIFSAGARTQTFERARPRRARQLGAAVELGVTHIFEGLDHLLFLIALLLPSVLAKKEGRFAWVPVEKLRPALGDVLRIVTAFTVAHSITLTLSALDVVRLPSRFVESGIALSVVLAAANNVYPVLRRDRWVAAFALGLLHGFGFSATLMDLGLPRQNLVLTLFGFNVGVEIGQAMVVAAFVPLAFLVRGTRGYRWVALVGGSIAIACVASVWLVERAL